MLLDIDAPKEGEDFEKAMGFHGYKVNGKTY